MYKLAALVALLSLSILAAETNDCFCAIGGNQKALAIAQYKKSHTKTQKPIDHFDYRCVTNCVCGERIYITNYVYISIYQPVSNLGAPPTPNIISP